MAVPAYDAMVTNMEQWFKRIMGYQQLWMLETKLCELAEEERIDEKSKVA